MNLDLQKVENLIKEMAQNMRILFGDFDLKNMNKNLEGLEFEMHGEHPNIPAFYGPEYNLISIKKDLSEFNLSDKELKYMITHEFSHMSSTRNAKSFFKILSGLQRGSGFFTKNIAITEGLTEYVTRKTTGLEIDIAYVFERKCAESLMTIFGNVFLQSYFDADCKSLYKHAKSLGISKKEMNELFDEMDKSLSWRNTSIKENRNNKMPSKNNKCIFNIEKKLVDMAARVGLRRNDDKESISNMINNIQKQFIPPNLEFSDENGKEEEFLSKYSSRLEEAFLYAKKMEEDIRVGRITSEEQIMPTRKTLFRSKKHKLVLPSSTYKKETNKANEWISNLKAKTNAKNNLNENNQNYIQDINKDNPKDDDLTI